MRSRDVRPIGDGVGMDEDGSAETGRTRLARGTKPHALGMTSGPASAVERGEKRADPDRSAGTAGSNAARGLARSETGWAPHGSAGGPGDRAPRGIDARGSGPVQVGGAPGGASRGPAQSICEAVEQLIEAQEADEAIAEWMQGGG